MLTLQIGIKFRVLPTVERTVIVLSDQENLLKVLRE